MSKAITPHEEMRAFFNFQKENIFSMLTQILKSKELTAVMNKLGAGNKIKYQQEINRLADRVIDREIAFYKKNYKVKSFQELLELIDSKLSPEELKQNRRRIVSEVVAELYP